MLQAKPDEREPVKMQGCQLPLIINNATTGHKLQGSSVDCLFVHSWNYVTNWPYVVCSRVRTKEGLFLRQPLSKVLGKYAVPPALLKMLDKLKERAPTYWDEDDYSEMFG